MSGYSTALIVIDVQESFRHWPYWVDGELPTFVANLQKLVVGAREPTFRSYPSSILKKTERSPSHRAMCERSLNFTLPGRHISQAEPSCFGWKRTRRMALFSVGCEGSSSVASARSSVVKHQPVMHLT